MTVVLLADGTVSPSAAAAPGCRDVTEVCVFVSACQGRSLAGAEDRNALESL